MSKPIILDSEPSHFGPFEWFRNTCNAARCRTPERIDFFIQLTVPALSSLLCITCSTDAHELMTRRHPTLYRDIKDDRGENIGMWLWMYDLHNDVNKKLGKPEFPLEDAYRIYNPILLMTTEELEKQFKAAMDPSTMSGVPLVEFTDDSVDEVEPEVEKVAEVAPSVLVEREPIKKPLKGRDIIRKKQMVNKKQVKTPETKCTTCGTKQ